MSKEKNLENVKKLREITGVGFKDCKLVLDENNGDIEKSVEYLRKKGRVFLEIRKRRLLWAV